MCCGFNGKPRGQPPIEGDPSKKHTHVQRTSTHAAGCQIAFGFRSGGSGGKPPPPLNSFNPAVAKNHVGTHYTPLRITGNFRMDLTRGKCPLTNWVAI